MSDIKEKSRFILGITNSESNDSNDWRLDLFNNGVSQEVIIMQLKALIKSLKNNYFEDFNNKLIKK